MENKTQNKSILSKLLVSQSGEQDRRTPMKIFKDLNKEFKFGLDPCTSSSEKNNLKTPHYFTKKQDGLKQDWSKYKSIFINPPFKNMRLWVDKIIEEVSKNKEMVIVLLAPAKTETQWFHKLLGTKYLKEIRFQLGRVTFEGHTNPFIIGICYFVICSSECKKI